MNKRSAALLLALTLGGGLLPAQRKATDLPSKYRTWLEEEVVYIVTEKEKKVFLALEADRDRDLFITAFWRQRDPDPQTPANEYKDEHYRRIEFANREFGRLSSVPGWKTDRGRIHILLGPPLSIQPYDNFAAVYPTIAWNYQGFSRYGLPDSFYVLFYRRFGSGDYRLYSPGMDGPESLVAYSTAQQIDTAAAYDELQAIEPMLARLSLSLIPGEPMMGLSPSMDSDRLLLDIASLPRKVVADEYAEKLLRSKGLVEVEYSANYIGNEALMHVIADPQGFFFVNYLVEIDRFAVNLEAGTYATRLAVNGRVTDPEGRTVFQFERTIPIRLSDEQFAGIQLRRCSLEDSFPLVAGRYTVSLIVKNEASKEFTLVERDIIVPDVADLGMTQAILAYRSEADPTDRQKAYKPGNRQLYTSPRHDFGARDKLGVFFQVSGLTDERRNGSEIRIIIVKAGQPVRTVERRLGPGGAVETFWEELDLADIPPDYYSLRASLYDGSGREILHQESPFLVSPAAAVPRPWINIVAHRPSTDPAYRAILGEQHLRKGDARKARAELEAAYARNPEIPAFTLSLAAALFELADYGRAIEVLTPFAERGNVEVLAPLARSCLAAGKFDLAIGYLRGHLAHFGADFTVLNLLGESYLRAGERVEAIAAWERSLALNPDQPELRKRIETVKFTKTPRNQP